MLQHSCISVCYFICLTACWNIVLCVLFVCLPDYMLQHCCVCFVLCLPDHMLQHSRVSVHVCVFA